MRSRTIVSLALFALVALALPFINRQGSQASSPAIKVPELTKRLQGEPASDYLKEHGLYVRLQNLIESAQYQIDQQPQDAVYPLQVDSLFTQTKKLTASDTAANDRFGYSVATNGDTVVVGAYSKN